MGNSKSAPRKITIDNPEDATVIVVTENVIDRLQDIKPPTSSYVPVSPPSPPPQPPQPKETPVTSTETVTGTVYVTSHQIRNHIDAAIEDNNAYWQNRMRVLRDGYDRINSELKSEYDKAITEVNQSWGKQFLASEKNDLESCKQMKQEVIQCYNSNRDRSLLCSEQVKNFNQCVSNQTNALLKAN